MSVVHCPKCNKGRSDDFIWNRDCGKVRCPAYPGTVKVKVQVYLDDGRVAEYPVKSPISGREHASAIIKTGYRSTPVGSRDLEWYPPHRIVKVKVIGGGESSKYQDTWRAT